MVRIVGNCDCRNSPDNSYQDRYSNFASYSNTSSFGEHAVFYSLWTCSFDVRFSYFVLDVEILLDVHIHSIKP